MSRARQSARECYPNPLGRIVLLDGEPVGWMVTAANEEEIWLVALIIAQEQRGKGVGSEVLQSLFAVSDRAGKPVRLSVRVNSPALRLYERLGFHRTGGDEQQHVMERIAIRGQKT